jgi:hypothetical protein
MPVILLTEEHGGQQHVIVDRVGLTPAAVTRSVKGVRRVRRDIDKNGGMKSSQQNTPETGRPED